MRGRPASDGMTKSHAKQECPLGRERSRRTDGRQLSAVRSGSRLPHRARMRSVFTSVPGVCPVLGAANTQSK